jgi:bla regulator protein blaR1
MIPEPLTSLANHLWQSTLFAGVAGLLALLLKRNRAAVRYGLWLTASTKFLLPFSLLIVLGHQMEWPTDRVEAPTLLISTVEGFGYPFTSETTAVPVAAEPPTPASVTTSRLWIPLLFVWLCGAAFVAFRWVREWRRMRLSLVAATPLELNLPLRVLTTSSAVEPGIVGVVRPVLLLPKGLLERLTPAQVDAVFTHELCHVRRRDNLAAALHMMVEVLFWFHPLVWWIERRLVDERERACDEEVLRSGGEPQIYAEGILNICRFYKESPLVCISGVTGSNLKKRIEEIMRNQVARKLSFSRFALLAAVAILSLAGPVLVGVVTATGGKTESAAPTSPAAGSVAVTAPTAPIAPVPQVQPPQKPPATAVSAEPRETFDVASVRPTRFSAGGERGLGGNGNASIRPPQDPCGDHPNSFFLKFDPSRALVSDMTVHGLIAWAWGLPCQVGRGNPFILGGPGWTKSDGFDIEALIPAGPPVFTSEAINIPGAPPTRQTMTPRFRKMLQSLLEDRFKLVLRRETREWPVYALTVAKGGLKMTPWKEGDPATFAEFFAKLGLPPNEREMARQIQELGQQDRSNPAGLKAPITVLMNQIKQAADRPVIDRTGISQDLRFNYMLTFSRLLPPYPPEPWRGATNVTAPSLFTALEDELGLKLEATTAPMEVWVIERLERPSEN